MAKSDNFFELKGKIGNLIFCQRNGKTYVKRYSGGFVNGDSHNHPNSKLAQKNFKEYSVLSKELRNALAPMLLEYKETNFYNQCVSYWARLKRKEPTKSIKVLFHKQQQLLSRQEQWINQTSKISPLTVSWEAENGILRMNMLEVDAILKQWPYASIAIQFITVQIKEDLPLEMDNHQFFILNREDIAGKNEVEFSIGQVNS